MTPRVEHINDYNFSFIHDCVSGENRQSKLSLGSDDWQWVGEDTLRPSLLCQTEWGLERSECGVHGSWTNGKWEPV